jgi:hypothetical protein
MPAWVLPAVGMATGMAGQGMNIHFQKKTNERQMEFAREMYGLQREHARQDWDDQNRYNHPVQQMQRLREAGLNPSLIYGKGAQNTAQMIRSSSAPNAALTAPRIDPKQGGLFDYVDIRQKQAQTDNIDASTAVQRSIELMNEVKTIGEIAKASREEITTSQAKDLYDTVIDRAKLENKQIEAQTKYTLDKNQREQVMNPANVQKVLTDIVATQEQTENTKVIRENLKNTKKVQELDLNLRREGIMPGDPAWLRIMMQQLSKP